MRGGGAPENEGNIPPNCSGAGRNGKRSVDDEHGGIGERGQLQRRLVEALLIVRAVHQAEIGHRNGGVMTVPFGRLRLVLRDGALRCTIEPIASRPSQRRLRKCKQPYQQAGDACD